MPNLKGKTILIISPDKWNNLRLSKHNYAEELAEMGNNVFYLLPPETRQSRKPIIQRKLSNNLQLVEFNTFVKGERFIPSTILNFIRKYQATELKKLLGGSIDIVWSFYGAQFFDLSVFGKSFKIFHPVDKIIDPAFFKTAKNANIVLSVAQNILDDLKPFNKNLHVINHGINHAYEDEAKQIPVPYQRSSVVKIGYVGNLIRPDIDHAIFLKMIHENPSIEFHLWGSYENKHIQWNQESDQQVLKFVEALKSSPNVFLKGLVHPEDVRMQTREMDLFLCCYDAAKEMNQCSNNHKLMEYFSNGKIVVSHFVQTYAEKRYLLEMCSDHSNMPLPELLSKVVKELEFWNSQEKQLMRKTFALDNTYQKQIKRIENIIEGL